MTVRRTKIISTIGPASDTDDAVRALIAAGTDVFRLNFSHGTHEQHRASAERIRRAAEESGRVVALMQDLSGPKIRTGDLEGNQPLMLKEGEPLDIVIGDDLGRPGRVSTTFPLHTAVSPGDTLLLDDGHLSLKVQAVSGTTVSTTVVDGGPLSAHKGINVPGVELPHTGLTPKDAADLAFGAALGVDFVAMSFVQSAADLRAAREALRAAGTPHTALIAKLERPAAITRIDEILDACDAVMVARGDLGLELPLERVPRVQKEVIRKARGRGMPVIVATQVLDSMRTEPRPTRAEVSDAANAVDDGVDAIMLTGETAAGKFPVRAVQTLDLVIRDAELIPSRLVPLGKLDMLLRSGVALCEAAVTLGQHSQAAAIVAVTRSGRTARVLAALRPRVPIYAVTERPEVARWLTLAWGVRSVVGRLQGDLDGTVRRAADELAAREDIAPESMIVVVSVSQEQGRGPSNFVKLQRV